MFGLFILISCAVLVVSAHTPEEREEIINNIDNE